MMKKAFQILPAIDLLNKKCVRLLKGDFSEVTIYNDDPVAQAITFQEQGAKYLHVVDLEGSKQGDLVHFETVKSVVASTNLEVEVGGGIRSIEDIQEYLRIGVWQVIVGSKVVMDEEFCKGLVNASLVDKVTIALDFKENKVMSQGWLEASEYTPLELLTNLAKLGFRRFIYTDISKDGTLQGPNLSFLDRVREVGLDVDLIVSGGVKESGDIARAEEQGASGVIIGKALYEGRIDLWSVVG